MSDFGFVKVIPKSMFFDRARVQDALSRGRHAALSKIGAFIRQRARSLTGRRSKNSAQPGQSPKRHAGQLHDLIFFAYDDHRDSALIGPVLFKASPDVISIAGGGTVPEVLEQGGEEVLRDPRNGTTKRVQYAPRPYMAPALAEAQGNGKLLAAWRDCVID